MNKVVTVKGWYEETLTAATRARCGISKARIVHIDCDLYESARLVLDFVTPLIQEGTVIIFDDWFQFSGNPERGEQRAFSEWLGNNSQFQAIEYMRQFPWACSFIVTFRLDANQQPAQARIVP